jgi:DNA-binding CsgD family transcriptional regulator
MKSENEPFNYFGTSPEDARSDSIRTGIIAKEFTSSLKMPEACSIFPFSNCLVDHSGRQFVCFHQHCLKNDSCFKNEFLDELFDFQALHFHPDDKVRLQEKIFPDILRFLEGVPADKLSDYRFSFNHRYIRKDGRISQFLQEGTLSVSDEYLPVLNLKVFTEIEDFKTDESMILSIFRYSADQGYQKVYTKVYGNNDTTQLSHREIEIIKLCLEGLSSKMIADKLNLSIHTVKNHKRNCMEKTLTHNITELINLCIRSHWL